MIRRQTLLPISITACAVLAQGICGATEHRPGGQIDPRSRIERFRAQGSILTEETPTRSMLLPTEALSGFDNQSNGFDVQGADYSSLNSANVQALRSFNDNRFV